MKYMYFLLLIIIVVFGSSDIVFAAGEIVHCGDVSVIGVETEPQTNFCNIYARQIAYRNSNIEFHKQLEERQKNYAIPSAQARKDYEINLEIMYEEMNSSKD